MFGLDYKQLFETYDPNMANAPKRKEIYSKFWQKHSDLSDVIEYIKTFLNNNDNVKRYFCNGLFTREGIIDVCEFDGKTKKFVRKKDYDVIVDNAINEYLVGKQVEVYEFLNKFCLEWEKLVGKCDVNHPGLDVHDYLTRNDGRDENKSYYAPTIWWKTIQSRISEK